MLVIRLWLLAFYHLLFLMVISTIRICVFEFILRFLSSFRCIVWLLINFIRIGITHRHVLLVIRRSWNERGRISEINVSITRDKHKCGNVDEKCSITRKSILCTQCEQNHECTITVESHEEFAWSFKCSTSCHPTMLCNSILYQFYFIVFICCAMFQSSHFPWKKRKKSCVFCEI